MVAKFLLELESTGKLEVKAGTANRNNKIIARVPF